MAVGKQGRGTVLYRVEPRDYGTLLLFRLQGVNQFVQLRGCGRAAAAPRIQMIIRSGVHSASNTGGRPGGRCVGCGVVPLLLGVNCPVFCVLCSVFRGADRWARGSKGARGRETDWTKVLDRNRGGASQATVFRSRRAATAN